MDLEARTLMRQLIISLVLSTDLICHFRLLNIFEARVRAHAYAEPAAVEAGDKLLLMQIVLKAADVSNAYKPASLSLEWSSRILQEQWLQGDAEREMGFQVLSVVALELLTL
jgi:cAMP-specific phosphodiesterase 4